MRGELNNLRYAHETLLRATTDIAGQIEGRGEVEYLRELLLQHVGNGCS